MQNVILDAWPPSVPGRLRLCRRPHTRHRSVTMGVCTWFLIHTLTLPSTAVFQHRVFKWSIINEPVCSWFIPNANKILSILQRDVKVKAVSSPSLSSLSLCYRGDGLPAPSRWDRIHIFSWLSWPQEASRNSTQPPSAQQTENHTSCWAFTLDWLW